mmetsp:Transcript_4726/g.11741  ORF Transcript_4726/g.11741 Transcript_4726/m.11741 type:complete len:339 (-) Transcript_4726:30-1046(-)
MLPPMPRRLAPLGLIAVVTLLASVGCSTAVQQQPSAASVDERLALAEEAVEKKVVAVSALAPTSMGFNESKYPPCPPSPQRGNTTDVEYVIKGFEAALVLDGPFDFITYWCNVWPPDLYAAMETYFPPAAAMEAAKLSPNRNKKGFSAAGSNNYANLRYKISGYDLIKWSSATGAKKYGSDEASFQAAAAVWTRVEKVLFSEAFTAAVWRKFRVTRANKKHDFRLQIDHAGYSIGVHPDSPKKVLTMQFYLPEQGNAEQVKSFGTCVHTKDQYRARDFKSNGRAPCEKKFSFLPNSAYSFTVHAGSYHSVDGVGKAVGLRKSVLVNWYDQDIGRPGTG